MTDPSIALTLAPRKCPADLICPECGARCCFSSSARRITCPNCGFSLPLTDEQHADLVDAIAGITDLNIEAYLRILAIEHTGLVAT